MHIAAVNVSASSWRKHDGPVLLLHRGSVVDAAYPTATRVFTRTLVYCQFSQGTSLLYPNCILCHRSYWHRLQPGTVQLAGCWEPGFLPATCRRGSSRALQSWAAFPEIGSALANAARVRCCHDSVESLQAEAVAKLGGATLPMRAPAIPPDVLAAP